jgi:hypothetical protein
VDSPNPWIIHGEDKAMLLHLIRNSSSLWTLLLVEQIPTSLMVEINHGQIMMVMQLTHSGTEEDNGKIPGKVMMLQCKSIQLKFGNLSTLLSHPLNQSLTERRLIDFQISKNLI